MIIISAIGMTAFLLHNARSVYTIHEAKATAETERNIVAPLFPEKVIARMLEEAEAQKAARKEKDLRRQLKRSPGSVTESSSNEDKLSSEGLFGSKPITDFYPQATITLPIYQTLPPGRVFVSHLKCFHCWKLSTIHLTRLQNEEEFSKWR